MLKRIRIFLAAALLLCLCAAAGAEGGVIVEVIRADGVSVVTLTNGEAREQARGLADSLPDARRAEFILPEHVTLIEAGAFEGIAAKRVEISANVAAVEARAFAGCESLREIYIPATVLRIDDSALEGCKNVKIYGVKGTEAERFAEAAGFKFVDMSAGHPHESPKPPVELPLVPRR